MLATRLRLALGAMLACGLLGLGAYGIAQVPAPLPERSANRPAGVAENPSTPAIDPLTGDLLAQQTTQPKQPMKVAPKGIEDDDVPYASFPSQAVVRIEEGKLIVRQRGHQYQTVTVAAGGGLTAKAYHAKSGINVTTHDPADIAVFDMRGNRLLPKAWKDKFQVDVHVLVGYDGKLPNPRELALLKDDTLLVVLPGSASAVPGTVYGAVVGPHGGTYYQPVPPAPATVPPPPAARTRPAQPGTPAVPPLAPLLGTARLEPIPPQPGEVPMSQN